MTQCDELKRENAALRERIATLSAAIARISASLDLDTVLGEVVDGACALTGARPEYIFSKRGVGVGYRMPEPGER